MMKKSTLLLSLAATALIAGAVTGVGLPWMQEDGVPPDLPQQAVGVRAVISARPYVLEEPYVHRWRAEAPETSAGYLLVLDVEEPFTIPRDSLESVLYVGGQTAERINWGTGSGRVVALCPSALNAAGEPSLELSSAPIFYGSPALPEEVDAAAIRQELNRAAAAGVGALPISDALETGGELIRFQDKTALVRHAATLVLEHSPAEADLAQGLLVPLLR